MKAASAALKAHLESECTTVAWLVRVTRRDGVVMGFTTHDRDLTVDGTTYLASAAVLPSTVESNNAMSVDNLDIQGALSSEAITDADIARGLYDLARLDVFLCNWSDPSMGTVQMRRGWLGEIETRDGTYRSEIRGMLEALQKPIGRSYTVECNADLGDARCKVDVPALSHTTAVVADFGFDGFVLSGLPENVGFYTSGRFTVVDGPLAGYAGEIKSETALAGSSRRFGCWLPLPEPLTVGTTVTVAPGCDKRISTCRTKFGNILNFRGFPTIPGRDQVLQYPDAKA